MKSTPDFEDLCAAAQAEGLACRGGFYPEPADGVPDFTDGGRVATLVLFGFVGRRQWPVFASSEEAADGKPHPLDRWSRRVIDRMGARLGARGLYPMDGPPWLPFQRWARLAEPVHASPLNILIHPDFGLWHAYRGALAFRARLDVPVREERASPCDTCAAKPCVNTCPVSAVRPGHFDRESCDAHLASQAGVECLRGGCLARRSCPVGAEHRYGDSQSAFHMAAYAGRGRF